MKGPFEKFRLLFLLPLARTADTKMEPSKVTDKNMEPLRFHSHPTTRSRRLLASPTLGSAASHGWAKHAQPLLDASTILLSIVLCRHKKRGLVL
jgi:hypothetical protein